MVSSTLCLLKSFLFLGPTALGVLLISLYCERCLIYIYIYIYVLYRIEYVIIIIFVHWRKPGENSVRVHQDT